MKIAALIPAYQPDEKLITLLEELSAKTDYFILVVNDGSRAECAPTFEQAKKYSEVIAHEVNRGKGAALKTGIKYILENTDCDGVVTLDADGQHTVSDTQRTVGALIENPDSFIVGGRLFSGKVPWKSRAGNGITEPQILAAYILVAIPSAIFWCFGQKFVLDNYTVGGLKE